MIKKREGEDDDDEDERKKMCKTNISNHLN